MCRVFFGFCCLSLTCGSTPLISKCDCSCYEKAQANPTIAAFFNSSKAHCANPPAATRCGSHNNPAVPLNTFISKSTQTTNWDTEKGTFRKSEVTKAVICHNKRRGRTAALLPWYLTSCAFGAGCCLGFLLSSCHVTL